MLAAFFLSRFRAVHVPIMASIILFDAAMPYYLYATRDWSRRLIEQGEILSFMIWMHFILVLLLYALYVVQVATGLRLLRNEAKPRPEHRGQGIAILIVRVFVIATAALLVDTTEPVN